MQSTAGGTHLSVTLNREIVVEDQMEQKLKWISLC